jgi:hypothetical protein
MAASFSFRKAASAALGRRESSWADARDAEPMANPTAVTAAAATSEVIEAFLILKIRAFETNHVNLMVSPLVGALLASVAEGASAAGMAAKSGIPALGLRLNPAPDRNSMLLLLETRDTAHSRSHHVRCYHDHKSRSRRV